MTARVCQMFLTKGGTLNKNGTPKSVCSFATSCPNFGKSSCGLMDMEDLFLSTNVTSEKKKVANLFSSRQNLLKQQQQESNTEKNKVMSILSARQNFLNINNHHNNNDTNNKSVQVINNNNSSNSITSIDVENDVVNIKFPNLKREHDKITNNTNTNEKNTTKDETMINEKIVYNNNDDDDHDDEEISCYKKQLSNADPTLIPFNSRKGRQLFGKAFETGLLDGSYWDLGENYSTQSEPSFCALTSLVMALNSLGIDPKRKAWSTKPEIPWRWYTENSLLSCCDKHKTLSEINLSNGMNIHELYELAECQDGVSVKHFFPSDDCKEAELQADDHFSAAESPIPVNENMFRQDLLSISERNITTDVLGATDNGENHNDDDDETCAGKRMIVNFSRSALEQTGEHGHFSCIGAYEAESDMALVMETARFKYPPFWVPTSLLYKAMASIDPESGLPRGYLLVERDNQDMIMNHDDFDQHCHTHSSTCGCHSSKNNMNIVGSEG